MSVKTAYLALKNKAYDFYAKVPMPLVESYLATGGISILQANDGNPLNLFLFTGITAGTGLCALISKSKPDSIERKLN
jgi:hypothetical protein